MSEIIKLKVQGIVKTFPGVKALDDINFSVEKGSVHVLCGENGAGKSTLMKIINGIYKPDKGSIFIDGKEVQIKNPIDARNYGIGMIFQELNYIPDMTIEESFFLGNWPKTSMGTVDWSAITKKAKLLMEKENLNYDVKTKLKDLSVSDIQMLEILKAISYNSDIIIMDEPTSAITNKEVDVLFKKIEDLKSRGKSIIYISHKMDEIFRIADHITVFRDGKVVGSKKAEELNIDDVITMMVGRKMGDNYPKEIIPIGEIMLDVQGLSLKGCYEDISFNVKKGEIIGFAGLMGAKRTEVMRGVFGLDSFDKGKIVKQGKYINIRRVEDSIKNKIVMLSEDRRRFGIIPMRSIRENVSLSSLSKFIYGGKLHEGYENEVITRYCDRMKVKTPDYETTIESLSGGNQQKVLLAKWMVADPDVFIVDEPTRGIDVGAKYEIYKLITEVAKEGKAVIMVSSELPELIGMCDRVYVMAKGKIQGELQRDQLTQESIMSLATQ